MISDTLIPDTKIPDSLLTVGPLGAHQLFLLTPNSLKVWGICLPLSDDWCSVWIGWSEENKQNHTLDIHFSKDNKRSQWGQLNIGAEKLRNLSILGGFEAQWDEAPISQLTLLWVGDWAKNFLQSFPTWVNPMTSWPYCAKHILSRIGSRFLI